MAEKEPRTDPELLSLEQVQTCRHENCGCDMVYPIDWEQREGTIWEVTLRCPNCEDAYPGLMDEDVIEQFDSFLDRGTDVMVRDLRNLSYRNMAVWVNQFVEAVNEGHILPEDFNFTPRPGGDTDSGYLYQNH